MSTKKTWKPEEKLAVVMDGLRGRPVREICTEYGISDAQYYKWRDEALRAMQGAFQDKRTKTYSDSSLEAERNRLLKIIGEKELIIELQKKITNTYR